MKHRPSTRFTSLTLVAFFVSGCATIISGTTQDLPLSLNPPGTEVSVFRWNGELVGGPAVSPGTVRVHRPEWDQPYVIRARKNGYCPQYFVTTRSSLSAGGWVSSIVYGLALPAALFLLPVDLSTGAPNSINPSSLEGSLDQETECAE
jgi:uncharacterized protein YceK